MKHSGRLFLCTVLMVMAIVNAVFGQAPKTLSYQGYLSDGGGPLTGTHSLTFTIYDDASGGTNLWTETSTGVVAMDGSVSLMLGKLIPINIQTVIPMWMGIAVDGNPEISPRVELSGSLYALGLALPYEGTVSGSNAGLRIASTGTGYAGMFETLNPASSAAGVYAGNYGTGTAVRAQSFAGGNAGQFEILNTSSITAALYARTNGSGTAFAAEATGNAGTAGSFTNLNAASFSPSLRATAFGTGPASEFTIVNSSSTAPVLNLINSGTGNAITANRPIQATKFIGDGSLLTNLPSSGLTLPFAATSTDNVIAFDIVKTGLAPAAKFATTNPSNFNPTLHATTVAGVYAGQFESNGAFWGGAVLGLNNGLGTGGEFRIDNGSNSEPALRVETNGTGPAGRFTNTKVSSTSPALEVEGRGMGFAMRVSKGNVTGSAMHVFMPIGSSEAAIYISQNGSGAAIYATAPIAATQFVGQTSSTFGNAGSFSSSHISSPSAVLLAQGAGSGPSVRAEASGTGRGLQVSILNAASTADAINISHAGTGNAITANRPIQATQFIGDGSLLTGVTGLTLPFSQATGAGTVAFQIENTAATGVAGFFRNSNINNTGSTLLISNSAQNGWGLQAYSEGGPAAIVQLANPSGSNVALMASNDGLGTVATLTQYNTSNSAPALQIQHVGTGNAITANRPIQATQFIAQGNGTPAIQISSGGLRYNVTEVTSSSIATRSTVYNIASGGSSYTVSFSGVEGDTFYAFNSTGSSITIEGVALGAGELGQLLYVAGAWRGM